VHTANEKFTYLLLVNSIYFRFIAAHLFSFCNGELLIVFMRNRWSNLEEFKHDFEHCCKEIHQVFAVLDSRTEQPNRSYLSKPHVEIKIIM